MINKRNLYLITPILSVYLINIFFPINIQKFNNKKIWFQPPDYVFGIVWPILLTLLGYSWYLEGSFLLYSILTFLLTIWTNLFSINKYYSFIDIILSILITLYLIICNKNEKSAVLLVPLLLWLIFASILNYYQFKF